VLPALQPVRRAAEERGVSHPLLFIPTQRGPSPRTRREARAVSDRRAVPAPGYFPITSARPTWPRSSTGTCSCGSPWYADLDRCLFCDLVRDAGAGARRGGRRRWRAGPLRRALVVERVLDRTAG